MGLTKPRAYQIFDIDYKQSVRVITLTNVTLSGGAPSSVDGVNLSVGDRILVAGQSTGSQNGLYQVSVLGTGSDGTWIRSVDGNETGEIDAGMIVMVTEGEVYKDTQWKLITNDPITIGTTALVFEQNSAFAFGNIYANGTAVLANTVGDTVTFSAGDNIAITGNATAKSVTIAVTGISLNSISNGTSNVTVVSSGGNVTVGVAGSEVAEFSTVGQDLTGALTVSGNVTGGNLNTAGQVVATGNVIGGNLVTAGLVSATGNVTGGNLVTAGRVTATGNITGGNIATAGELKTTGTFLIGTQQFYAQGSDGFSVNENFNAGNSTVTAYHYTSGSGRNAIVFDTAVTGQFTTGFGTTGTAASNKFVFFAEFGNTFWEWRKGVGISAPNLNGGTLLANISADGNLWTAGTITGTGNIIGGNLTTTGTANIGTLAVTGTSTFAGNLLPTANITYNLGSSTQRWNDIWLANSTVYLGNAQISANATSLILTTPEGAQVVLSGSSAEISASTVTATGNITGGNLVTAGTVSAATLSTTGNATIGGNLTVQGNLIYVNVEDLRVEDPVIIMGTGPNGDPLTSDDGQDRGIYMEYYTTGLGNAFVGWQNSSGNLIAASDVSFSANNVISVTEYGTLQAGNLYVQSVDSIGNITGSNIVTAGEVVATGNVTGNFFNGDGSALTGINSFGTIVVAGSANVVADNTSDTLTLVAGDGVVITTSAGTDTITIATSGSSESIFITGGDMGTVDEAVTSEEDLGLITEAVGLEIDMGSIVTSGVFYPDQLVLPSKTVAELGNLSAIPAGQFVYCSDESGGSIPAFSDGTNWRRVTDRAIVT